MRPVAAAKTHSVISRTRGSGRENSRSCRNVGFFRKTKVVLSKQQLVIIRLLNVFRPKRRLGGQPTQYIVDQQRREIVQPQGEPRTRGPSLRMLVGRRSHLQALRPNQGRHHAVVVNKLSSPWEVTMTLACCRSPWAICSCESSAATGRIAAQLSNAAEITALALISPIGKGSRPQPNREDDPGSRLPSLKERISSSRYSKETRQPSFLAVRCSPICS